MTEKRFTIVDMGLDGKYIKEDGKIMEIDRVVDLLNENEQLKSKNKGLQSELQIFKEDVTHSNLQINKLTDENEQLKQTISKIDFAIIRKYDNSLENLLDEVYDGGYNNWIQKQLLRAKKLNGDD